MRGAFFYKTQTVKHLQIHEPHLKYYKSNYDYVKNICQKYPNIVITRLFVKNLSYWDYSYLKKSITFWKKVLGKKQLFFQTDSILRKKNIEISQVLQLIDSIGHDLSLIHI